MLRRFRPLGSLLLPVALLLALSACGSKGDDPNALSTGDTARGIDAVKITGSVGSAPTLTWTAQMSAGTPTATTLIKGTGDKLVKGDQVLAHVVIANGFTKTVAFSTYDKDETTGMIRGPQTLKVGGSLGPLFEKAVDGAQVGSRVAVTAGATQAFGDGGQPNLSIGNKDAVLAIVDIMSLITAGPKGTSTPAPDWMPAIKFTAAKKPDSFDFTGIPEPKGQFRKAILITGTGPKVAADQTVVVNYLGEVYDGTKSFDQSYTAKPLTKALSTLIKGWQQGLVGVPVGSRVVLQVPPALGYGTAGNSGAGIKPTDTLYFVIDILATG